MIEVLAQPAGISVLYFLQTVMFSLMVYILIAEYIRTRGPELIYKLFAAVSITVMNFLRSAILFLDAFYGYKVSDQYFPLIFNSVFILVILSLARAFVYEFVGQKKLMRLFSYSNVFLVLIVYAGLQYYWLGIHTNVRYSESIIQMAFSLYNIVLVSFLIFLTLAYRKHYKMRIALAFASIVAANIVGIYAFSSGSTPSVLRILQASVTLLIPALFGSVVFKELIEKNARLTTDLKSLFDSQSSVIHQLRDTGMELTGLSETIYDKAAETWGRLTEIKSEITVNSRVSRKGMTERIVVLSRDIEEMAGLSDSLKEVIDMVNKRTSFLTDISDKVSYIKE